MNGLAWALLPVRSAYFGVLWFWKNERFCLPLPGWDGDRGFGALEDYWGFDFGGFVVGGGELSH